MEGMSRGNIRGTEEMMVENSDVESVFGAPSPFALSGLAMLSGRSQIAASTDLDDLMSPVLPVQRKSTFVPPFCAQNQAPTPSISDTPIANRETFGNTITDDHAMAANADSDETCSEHSEILVPMSNILMKRSEMPLSRKLAQSSASSPSKILSSSDNDDDKTMDEEKELEDCGPRNQPVIDVEAAEEGTCDTSPRTKHKSQEKSVSRNDSEQTRADSAAEECEVIDSEDEAEEVAGDASPVTGNNDSNGSSRNGTGAESPPSSDVSSTKCSNTEPGGSSNVSPNKLQDSGSEASSGSEKERPESAPKHFTRSAGRRVDTFRNSTSQKLAGNKPDFTQMEKKHQSEMTVLSKVKVQFAKAKKILKLPTTSQNLDVVSKTISNLLPVLNTLSKAQKMEREQLIKPFTEGKVFRTEKAILKQKSTYLQERQKVLIQLLQQHREIKSDLTDKKQIYNLSKIVEEKRKLAMKKEVKTPVAHSFQAAKVDSVPRNQFTSTGMKQPTIAQMFQSSAINSGNQPSYATIGQFSQNIHSRANQQSSASAVMSQLANVSQPVLHQPFLTSTPFKTVCNPSNQPMGMKGISYQNVTSGTGINPLASRLIQIQNATKSIAPPSVIDLTETGPQTSPTKAFITLNTESQMNLPRVVQAQKPATVLATSHFTPTKYNNPAQSDATLTFDVPCQQPSQATSVMRKSDTQTDLKALIKAGLLRPGRNVLSLQVQDKIAYASLLADGLIQGAGGEIFRSPATWYRALCQSTITNALAKQRICYQGQPISNFKLPVDAMPDERSPFQSQVLMEDSQTQLKANLADRVDEKISGCQSVWLLSKTFTCAESKLPHYIWDSPDFPILSQDIIDEIDRW